jgi:hypothetical protein
MVLSNPDVKIVTIALEVKLMFYSEAAQMQ